MEQLTDHLADFRGIATRERERREKERGRMEMDRKGECAMVAGGKRPWYRQC